MKTRSGFLIRVIIFLGLSSYTGGAAFAGPCVAEGGNLSIENIDGKLYCQHVFLQNDQIIVFDTPILVRYEIQAGSGGNAIGDSGGGEIGERRKGSKQLPTGSSSVVVGAGGKGGSPAKNRSASGHDGRDSSLGAVRSRGGRGGNLPGSSNQSVQARKPGKDGQDGWVKVQYSANQLDWAPIAAIGLVAPSIAGAPPQSRPNSGSLIQLMHPYSGGAKLAVRIDNAVGELPRGLAIEVSVDGLVSGYLARDRTEVTIKRRIAANRPTSLRTAYRLISEAPDLIEDQHGDVGVRLVLSPLPVSASAD